MSTTETASATASTTVSYTERDAILFALAVGAGADRLDLVYEERLRVLPTFAPTLAQWAPDALGALGAFDVTTAVHGSQRLLVKAPLERSGELTTTARVPHVWDKGSAAAFGVEVDCDRSTATWSVFAPGAGGLGGERGVRPTPPGPARRPPADRIHPRPAGRPLPAARRPARHAHRPRGREGGGHAPAVPARAVHPAAVLLPLADALGAHPADLTELEARFAAPVFPGDQLALHGWTGDDTGVRFEASATEDRTVLSGGRARFAPAVPTCEETPDA